MNFADVIIYCSNDLRYCDYRIIVNNFGHVKHAVKMSYFVRNLLKAEIYE